MRINFDQLGLKAVLPVAALAAALMLAACGGGGGSAIPLLDGAGEGGRAGAGNEHFVGLHPNNFSIHGIDVSKYQGDIDWQAVRASGVKFAWIKATEGADHADSKFQQNWAGAKAAGVPRGAYHFVYWCRPHHEEIGWFKNTVPVDPEALPPVLDVEATPTSRTCKRTLYKDEVVREMREMLVDMERHYGKRPVIYVTVDFYQAILSDGEFSDYPMWVRSTKHPPHVPYGSRRWVFWQYQSDGYVPGIRGKVDKNAFAGSESQWRAWLAGKPY
ncbi:GH25 family lysozyme [Methylocella sp. CPCC 101449]|uniref:glycoside hydrolase family 25 protein n=1 Tax=Methylocella sp. CPCC 101449 TaxID=2987531 RepID=UPI00288DA90E|nr:GH25 family lysozyme [Methylocella sp. CPCC 101449]MDT2022720.1 glycoside hydrolase family 25 protein [Methylocella sp. CPCC 101449]